MTDPHSKALLLSIALLVLPAACLDTGAVDSGVAQLDGTFDGVAISSGDMGAAAGATAALQGDFLDVTITLRLTDDRYGAELVVENPTSTPIGSTLSVGGIGDDVTATVFREGQAPRAASGTVQFDTLEAVEGGAVAGQFAVDFPGGDLAGHFEAIVQ